MRLLSFIIGLQVLLLTAIIPAAQAQAQAPAWQAALIVGQVGSGVQSFVAATVADANDNVYIVGRFIGAITLGNTTLTANNPYNSCAYIAKWNTTSASFVWALQSVGPTTTQAEDVTVNGSNVYIAGTFTRNATFGTTTLAGHAAGAEDVFVAKVTDNGTSASFAWAVEAGGDARDVGHAVAVRGNEVFVAGDFSLTSGFGNQQVNSAGGTDAFVAKLTDQGTTAAFTWVQRAGGASDDTGRAVAVQGQNVYVGGNFRASASFGSLSLSSAGNTDIFVSKLLDTGAASNFVWTQRAGGVAGDGLADLKVEGTSIYTAGAFDAAATYGTINLTSVGRYDMVVSKLTDLGATSTFTWALTGGGTLDDNPVNLVSIGSNIYVAGVFTSPQVTFGTTTLYNIILNGTTFIVGDIFVAKLTDNGPSGAFNWAQRAGGSDYDAAWALAVSPTGTIYVGGNVILRASFGNYALASGNSAANTGFLALLTDNLTTATAGAASLPPLAFFPNPARTAVRVPAATAATRLTLTNALGREVRTATGATLRLADVPPGVYLLRAATPGQLTRTGKLVVE